MWLTKNFRASNQRTPARPAEHATSTSIGCSWEKRNARCKTGTYRNAARTKSALPVTHHTAGLGARSISQMVLVQERLVKTSAILPTIRVEKASARESASSCPQYRATEYTSSTEAVTVSPCNRLSRTLERVNIGSLGSRGGRRITS